MKEMGSSKPWRPSRPIGVVLAGCASPDVNPEHARANKGYVDFDADSPELSWEVARLDDRAQEFRCIFSNLELPRGGVLGLAPAPRPHRLRVNILDRVIVSPAELAVVVEDGRITPVRVTLTEAGTMQIETRATRASGRAYGRYGRRTKLRGDETARYQLSAAAAPPVAYQLKGEMPYAH